MVENFHFYTLWQFIGCYGYLDGSVVGWNPDNDVQCGSRQSQVTLFFLHVFTPSQSDIPGFDVSIWNLVATRVFVYRAHRQNVGQ